MDLLLDTSAYSALLKGSAALTSLITAASSIGLPLPVIAELKFGFMKGSRLDQNTVTLERFLAQGSVSIIMPSLKTAGQFAQLHLYAYKHGRILSHNDIWIAALAQENNSTLVTFDSDFNVFASQFGSKLRILATAD